MSIKRLLLLFAALLPFGVGVAWAHATLESSEPAPETTVTEPLEEIRLRFGEAVELDFSVFKVYELDVAKVDMTAENAWRRLNGLAGTLVSDVLESRNDSEARVDAGLANDEQRSEEVVIELQDDLAPSVYVVMWRILSIDTHGTQGSFVFEYAPQAQP